MTGKEADVHGAAGSGDVATLRAAIAAGAEVDEPDDIGMTPLLYAIFNGHAEAVDVLLAAGANANHVPPDDPASPLFRARDFGFAEIEASLIRFGGQTLPGED